MGWKRKTWTTEDELNFIENLGINRSLKERYELLRNYRDSLSLRENFGEMDSLTVLMYSMVELYTLEKEMKKENI